MGLLYYSTLKLSSFISIIPALFTELLAIPHKWKTFLSHKPNVLAGGSHGTDEYKRPSRFVLSLAPSAPHIGLSIAPTSLDIREYKPRQRGIIVPRSPRWIGKSPILPQSLPPQTSCANRIPKMGRHAHSPLVWAIFRCRLAIEYISSYLKSFRSRDPEVCSDICAFPVYEPTMDRSNNRLRREHCIHGTSPADLCDG